MKAVFQRLVRWFTVCATDDHIRCYFGCWRLASYLYLQDVVEQADQTEKAEVVRAIKDIAADTIISREMLEQEEVPVSSIHPQALSSLDEVVGRIA